MKDTKAKAAAKRSPTARNATGAAACDDLECFDETHTHGHRAKPVSLHPHDFRTALKGLLAVPWPQRDKHHKKR